MAKRWGDITHGELMSMTAEQLRKEVHKMRKAASGRRNTVKYNKEFGESPALKRLEDSGGIPSTLHKYRDSTGQIKTRPKTRNELLAAYSQLRTFLNDPTSTEAGMRNRHLQGLYKIYGVEKGMSKKHREALKKFISKEIDKMNKGKKRKDRITADLDKTDGIKRGLRLITKPEEMGDFWREFDKLKAIMPAQGVGGLGSPRLLQIMRNVRITDAADDLETMLERATARAREEYNRRMEEIDDGGDIRDLLVNKYRGRD